jgi:hypothetical protein
MIRYYKHHEINKGTWDNCINKSFNGLVYAQSWYLDIVSPQWEALIKDDYKSVMPLPAKRKLFLPYLFKPEFAQQLGIFSENTITEKLVLEFLDRIPRKFVKVGFNLNTSNIVSDRLDFTNRTNYELDLNGEYAHISSGYNENTRRNIKKASTSCLIANSEDIEEFVRLFSANAKEKIKLPVQKQLKQIIRCASDRQMGEIIIARDVRKNIVAGAFFLKTLGRVIYLASFTTPDGSKYSPMFFIVDEIVKKHAGQPLILDFEGSMIPGVARFFGGFGAIPTVYQMYSRTLFT